MKNKMTDELAVCGVNAVMKLAEVHPERINRLFFCDETAALFGDVCKRLAAEKKVYRLLPEGDLEKLCKSDHHQGCVAMIKFPLPEAVTPQLASLLASRGEPFLVLDRVSNANNLGAIIRTCGFFGLKTIILSGAPGQALVSTSSYRIAEGGMEFVTCYRADDLEAFMREAKGKLVFAGADHRGKQMVAELREYRKEGTALGIVLGNEEEGMTGAVRKRCDVLVRIPGTGAIESLNVSAAAAVAVSRLME